ncbi:MULTISPECIES: IS3 family transposase [unclassified Acinetobacter]|uniref:IS3 family transposase n=1 Tax=unclassified Acinetobacter TaxID=196816 RepID=UPI0029348B5C|nr:MULTISPECIES: IS3 family transposase [unclassified Acinetobacter]WOE30747.1 IS3 family transposase [Acinetobacter sp. SAAs470]WOE31758.1 IS3 family transposase [Acinetobacter sp. SAAs470]WOE32244.1 IS3 family transposase [Acinetobacter sp. SAAs470]WOE32282.1 IS3 family transposase [Acinetobacter sp. SAAs470]WOE33292.1 IS3 family transposase [Acinetobacter sp. SAAs470]
MSSKRYPEEFKIEAVKQVTEKGHSVAEVATRLGTTTHSLYAWIKRYDPQQPKTIESNDPSAELAKLKKELQRVTEERDILKKGRGVLRKPVQMRYAFIQDNQHIWPVRRLCSTLDVHHSGYYAWLKQPTSETARKRQQLSELIKQFWLESGGVYGYRKIHYDLKDVGESCGINRVHRLMKADGLKSQRGYRKPRAHAGTPAVIAANSLNRQFNPTQPNQLWVTDITYIRTHEGWLYLAVVIDLFSRLVVGWSMKSRITTDLVLDALLMALWRRNPKNKVLIHSDQGSQYTSHEWQTFLKHHNLESSMSRRGNCHDNAVAESFFQLLKRERIKKKIYVTRTEARSDIFEYIEMFYNSKRRHGSNGQRSPLDYEKAHQKMVMCV